MTTLLEYAKQQFPDQSSKVWLGADGSGLELCDYTVVAHVVGADDGLSMVNIARRSSGHQQVGAVLVTATPPSVVPTEPEDGGGIVDLPRRRIAVAAITGAVVVGAATLIGLSLTGSALTALIVATFAAVIGAVIAAMMSGAGRYAGQRADFQPQVPGQEIAIVATRASTESEATDLARLLEQSVPHELRIVSSDGGWRSPNT